MLRAFPSLPLTTLCKGGGGHTVIDRGVTWGTVAGRSFQVSGKAGAQCRHSSALTPSLLKSRGISSPPPRGEGFRKPPFRTAFCA